MKAPPTRIKTALVPIGVDGAGLTALDLAKSIAKEVVLVGVISIEEGEHVSAGTQTARQIRRQLLSLSGGENIRFKSNVIVSETPWEDLKIVIEAEKPDLIIFEWMNGKESCCIPVADILSNSQCNVAIVRGDFPLKFDRTLIAVRGGPHAELALRVVMRMNPTQLDVLHLALSGATNDAPFKGINHVLKQMPDFHLRSIVTDDVVKSIFEESYHYDMVVLGVTASKRMGASFIGPVAEKLLRDSPSSVIVVKACRPISEAMFDESISAQAISILVDKWFAENTYHAEEFSDLNRLVQLKEDQEVTISLALPALNEEKTVGNVITTVKQALMDDVPLLDEIVLLDSDSTDNTRQIAEDLGIPVYIHQQLLPKLGAVQGKGEALWKSLLVTKGDIIAWIDTDIINIHPRFVYGILGPLLADRTIQFVKGFYRRPLRVGNKMQAGAGGRVTELTARPLLNLFYPELSGVIQPLSGEYGGRRESLEKATFFSGYGVETGLLIDIFENYGLRSIAQVDLLERVHHNQELEALSKMSFAIIQTMLRKLESRYERSLMDDVNKTMKLVHYSKGNYFLDVVEVAEQERPPMISLPEYRKHHKK